MLHRYICQYNFFELKTKGTNILPTISYLLQQIFLPNQKSKNTICNNFYNYTIGFKAFIIGFSLLWAYEFPIE